MDDATDMPSGADVVGVDVQVFCVVPSHQMPMGAVTSWRVFVKCVA